MWVGWEQQPENVARNTPRVSQTVLGTRGLANSRVSQHPAGGLSIVLHCETGMVVRKLFPTLRPGEGNGNPLQYLAHGGRSLVGYSPWSHKESNTSAVFLFCFLNNIFLSYVKAHDNYKGTGRFLPNHLSLFTLSLCDTRTHTGTKFRHQRHVKKESNCV